MNRWHPARWPLRTRVALAFLAATGVALTVLGVFVQVRVSDALEDRAPGHGQRRGRPTRGSAGPATGWRPSRPSAGRSTPNCSRRRATSWRRRASSWTPCGPRRSKRRHDRGRLARGHGDGVR